jgi:hypothetical protein
MSVLDSGIVKGTLFWAFLAKHNPMKPGKYTVDLGNLDKEAVAALKKLGLAHRVKEDKPKDGYRAEGDKFVSDDEDKPDKPNRGTFITLQSGFKPTVVNNFKQEVDPEIVGNGTVADVMVNAYEWVFKGTKGVSGGFNAVVVRDLVSFGGTGSLLDQFDFDTPSDEVTDSTDDDVDFEK